MHTPISVVVEENDGIIARTISVLKTIRCWGDGHIP